MTLKGGSRKKCAATAVVLARDAAGNPTDGKILIGGGYKSVAVDIWDLKTGTWSVSNMSISHFYMASASAGPFSLFCGGLAPSGDTSICDVYDARGAGKWSVTHLVVPVREISATSIDFGGRQLAVFMGGGHTQVFDAKTAGWTFKNSTPGRSPWAKMGRATVAGRYAVFAGSNGNGDAIEIFDSQTNAWTFAAHNLSIGREQVMGAGLEVRIVRRRVPTAILNMWASFRGILWLVAWVERSIVMCCLVQSGVVGFAGYYFSAFVAKFPLIFSTPFGRTKC